MRPDESFPLVRRGYDPRRVDQHVQTAAEEIQRLAVENRELHRQRATLAAARAERDRLRAEIEQARRELERLTGARADAERQLAELRSTRAEVQRELSTCRDVLRGWVAESGPGSVASMFDG